MQYIVTLTADQKLSPLTDGHANQVIAALSSAGSNDCSKHWLARGYAVDISFNTLPKAIANNIVTTALSGVPVDINIQNPQGRRKKLLIADMDSTINTNESLDDLAEMCGLGDKVKPITEKAMQGHIDFEQALYSRVRLLKGQPVGIIFQFLKEKVRIAAGAKSLVKTMQSSGATTALISGGFTSITNPIATSLGFDINLGNQLLIEDGLLTGDLSLPIVNSNTKLDKLISISKEKCIPIGDTIAVGDGANDIPMILHAGTGVAFRAKSKVKELAPFCVIHGDLRALLYIQGYSSNEIMT